MTFVKRGHVARSFPGKEKFTALYRSACSMWGRIFVFNRGGTAFAPRSKVGAGRASLVAVVVPDAGADLPEVVDRLGPPGLAAAPEDRLVRREQPPDLVRHAGRRHASDEHQDDHRHDRPGPAPRPPPGGALGRRPHLPDEPGEEACRPTANATTSRDEGRRHAGQPIWTSGKTRTRKRTQPKAKKRMPVTLTSTRTDEQDGAEQGEEDVGEGPSHRGPPFGIASRISSSVIRRTTPLVRRVIRSAPKRPGS